MDGDPSENWSVLLSVMGLCSLLRGSRLNDEDGVVCVLLLAAGRRMLATEIVERCCDGYRAITLREGGLLVGAVVRVPKVLRAINTLRQRCAKGVLTFPWYVKQRQSARDLGVPVVRIS